MYRRPADRLRVVRADQVCAYARRPYRRHARHNPYLLPSAAGATQAKTDLLDASESVQGTEQASTENFNNDIKNEPIMNMHDDQIVIPSDFVPLNKAIKRRMTAPFECGHCDQKFKTKNQLHAHSSTCPSEPQYK